MSIYFIQMIPKPIEIRFVDFGLANNFGDFIELHRDLRNYPNLMLAILWHEIKHEEGEWNLKDLAHDLTPNEGLKAWDVWKFMIKRPKTWIQMLPIYYQRDKGIVIDKSRIFIYSFLFIVFVLELAVVFALLR